MITLESQPQHWGNDTYKFEFAGKSTDTKPTGEYEGMKIANGSTFLSIDTQDVNFYDEETEGWL